jgi:hypothetical protein
MDAGIALKPLISVAGTHAESAVAVTPAAPSALRPEKTVPPVVNTAPARNEPRRPEKPPEKITRDAIIDPETNAIVYRVLDAQTRQVLHQVPEQAALRMQAYTRARAACALADGKNPFTAAQNAAQKFSVVT